MSELRRWIASPANRIMVACFNAYATGFAGSPVLALGAQTSRPADDAPTTMGPIGIGPFTAFVDITPGRIYPSGSIAVLFSSMSDGSGVRLYLDAAVLYLLKDGVTSIEVPATVTTGTRTKIALRRAGDGTVSVFKDGALKVSASSAAHDSTTPARFGSTVNAIVPDVIFHDYWLDYRALSNEDCCRVTRT